MWLGHNKQMVPCLNRPWDASLAHKTASIKSLLVSARSLCIKSPAYSQSIEARVQIRGCWHSSTFYHEKIKHVPDRNLEWTCTHPTQLQHYQYTAKHVNLHPHSLTPHIHFISLKQIPSYFKCEYFIIQLSLKLGLFKNITLIHMITFGKVNNTFNNTFIYKLFS